MKKLLCLLFALALAGPLYAQSPQVKELDAKNGFRDLKFGSSASLLANAKLENESGPLKMYSRPADALKIGEAQLANIYYIYFKDRLMTVRIFTKGQANSVTMRDAFVMQYGPGSQANRYAQKYSWHGQLVDMDYEEDSSGNALLDMSSQALVSERMEDHFKQAEKAKSDL